MEESEIDGLEKAPLTERRPMTRQQLFGLISEGGERGGMGHTDTQFTAVWQLNNVRDCEIVRGDAHKVVIKARYPIPGGSTPTDKAMMLLTEEL